ncbi:metallophosphoesterase [Ochrovirga pacifica]|uniref:metallophosphoesterase n=1 Tax=Ochrovirga pacifica TaxID=1042376 RepID=UPI000255A813|nr:metallophosphoesterase [Ochrovirga pacifica]
MKRKSFIKKGLLGSAALSIGLGTYAWQIEPYWLEFVTLGMPIKNLPSKLVGKTLMQISDIHVGNRFDWNYIIDSFQKAQKYKPDFVVYTGDFVNWENEEQYTQLQKVMMHAVCGELASIAILGNHDYGKNFQEQEVANNISNLLKNAGIDVLRNEKKNYFGLDIIGIDDLWGTNFFPEPVMKTLNKTNPQIALCHNPDVCDLPIWEQFEGWILSGHTHGGQVKPPFLPPFILPVKNKRYAAGKVELDAKRTLYINRALGNLFPVRCNVRPEITIFHLGEQ